MKKIVTLIFILQFLLSQAQFQKNVSIYPSKLKSLETIVVNPDFEFSSVSIETKKGANFDGAYLTTEQDTFYLQQDEDELNDSIVFSNLVIFTQNQDQIKFYKNKLTDPLTFHFLNAYTEIIKSIKESDAIDDNYLIEPESISQEEWREGLPTPDYERIVHEVQNLIIHHSAGSNTDTNYTNVIRNIYLYHTQTLEWSDIGYNYIVAQNGQLYKGRDPGIYEQDNVKGSHFCAQNSGTMGVCVLGNYEEVQASDTSLMTLAKLLAWKANKDNLDPYSTYSHPLNSALPCIAGHRDGCATLCPGTNLYNALPTIRFMVDSILTANNSNIETAVVEEDIESKQNQFVVDYQTKTINLIDDENSSTQVTIYDCVGKMKLQCSAYRSISFQNFLPGIYIIRLKTNKQLTTHKLLLY
jgi:hypothetical protein